MELVFGGEITPAKNIVKYMEQAASLALENEGVRQEAIEISITFVDGEEIREINNIFRNQDKITDVLSFPQYTDVGEIPAEGLVSLGDVVICTEQALLQADEYGHSKERELVYLFTHSIYHLLGYDHLNPEEKAEMRLKEKFIMAQVGLENEGELNV